MTVENGLGTVNMCLFWISLTMVTLSADCYFGTISLWQLFFAKCYFTKVMSFCMKMPGIIHWTGRLFMAVHLVGYGSVPILHSVFYLSQNSWEAPSWQVIAVDADVKQVVTSWLQTLNNSVFTLEYRSWYHCGTIAEVIAVTTLRTDVYHLLHVCHILIRVTITFSHEGVCYLSFWKFFVCTLRSEQVSSLILRVLNGGVSVSFFDKFYNELFVLVVTFTLLCPHNFVTCLT